ncbi:hypothetical protein AXX17_ATUG03440, partial [Arabidopsis thaliana]
MLTVGSLSYAESAAPNPSSAISDPASTSAAWHEVSIKSFSLLDAFERGQGVATDGNAWIFNSQLGLLRTALDGQTVLARNATAIPLVIALKGGDHIGDISYYNGKIYAPIEDSKNYQHPYIAIYDANTLKYTGKSYELPLNLHPGGVPWVAVDAARGQVYTAAWSHAAVLNVFSLSDMHLIKTVPLTQSVDRIQGAEVYDGLLYASSDNSTQTVYAIDPDTGSVAVSFDRNLPSGTEAQGIAVLPASSNGAILNILDYGKEALLGLTCAIVLAGCGQSNAENNDNGNASSQPESSVSATASQTASATASESASPSAKPVEISFYYPVNVGGPLTKVIDSMAADFTSKHPEIKVNPVYTGNYGDNTVKIQAGIQAKQPPDVAVMMSTELYSMLDTNAIIPLDDFIAKDTDFNQADFYPAFLEDTQTEGKTYSVPFQRSTIILYYNKDMFKAAGLDPEKPPKTWDELVTDAKKLNRDGHNGLEIPGNDDSYWMFQMFARQIASDPKQSIMSSDGKKAMFNTPENVAALQFWMDLSRKNKAMPEGIIDWGTVPTDFIEGKTAMMVHTSGNLTNVKKNAKFDFGVAFPPANKQFGSPTGGGNLYVFKDTSPEKQAASWEFIKYMTAPEQAALFSSSSGYVGVRKSAYDTEVMKTYTAGFPQALVARDQLEYAFRELSTHNHGKVSSALTNQIQSALAGKTDAASALKQAQEEADQALAAFNKERRAVSQTAQPFLLGKEAEEMSLAWSERWRRNAFGWGLVLPSLLFLGLFTYYPMLKSAWLSLYEKDLATPKPLFVGLDNYKLLLKDPVFLKVLSNNVWFAVGTVPASMALAFIMALFADKALKGKTFARVAFFYPNMIPMIAIANIWLFLYTPHFGLLAQLSSWISGSNVGLLGNPDTVLGALTVMMIWKEAGYFMIFYLAGMQQIPKDLYESASMDGVGAWTALRRITIPLTMPTTLFVAIIAVTNAFKLVDHLWIMTKGGPNHASSLILYHIYETMFNFYDQGMAAAMTTVMIVVLLLPSLAWEQSRRKERERRLQAFRTARIRDGAASILWHSVMLGLAAAWFIPFCWVVWTAFRSRESIGWLHAWTLDNFVHVWKGAPFGLYYSNTLIITLGVLLVQLVTLTLAAYAFARVRFFGGSMLFVLFLAQIMVPPDVLIFSNYQVLNQLGLLDTKIGIMLPYFASSFGVFLLRQAFRQLPYELEEAARVEGCSRLGILFRIYAPLCRPVYLSFIIVSVSFHWNDFLWPLIVSNSDTNRPLTVGLALFAKSTESGAQWSRTNTMKLALIGDLHYPANLLGRKDAEAARDAFYEAVLGAFLSVDADYHISLGDLTHEGTAEEYEAVYGFIRSRYPDRRFLHVLGNHDTHSLSKPDLEKLTGSPRYQMIEEQEMTMLLLDTAREMYPDNWGGTLDEEQLTWLAAHLPKEAHKPVLVFGHHPMQGTTARSNEEMMGLDTDSSSRLKHLLGGVPGAGFYWNGHNHVQSLVREGNWHYFQAASMLDIPAIWTVTLGGNELLLEQVHVGLPEDMGQKGLLNEWSELICRNAGKLESRAGSGPAMSHKPVKLAIVGGNRGASFLNALHSLSNRIELTATCDLNEWVLKQWKEIFPQIRTYRDYDEMLKDPSIDAVFLLSPMHLHARQSIDALKAGKHVLSEVIAVQSREEAWELIETVERTGLTYMMSENYCFSRSNLAILHMAELGMFGEITYLEGGYIHELRHLIHYPDGSLTWRGQLHHERNGVNYPTHSIGPVAQWIRVGKPGGDRLKSVAGFVSKSRSLQNYFTESFGRDHPAAREGFWRQGDSAVAAIQTERDVLITLRVDWTSVRPHNKTHFVLQGTKGAYLSGRHSGEEDLVWFQDLSPKNEADGTDVWEPLSRYQPEYDHPKWKQWGTFASQTKHGGGDFLPGARSSSCRWSRLMPVGSQSQFPTLERHRIIRSQQGAHLTMENKPSKLWMRLDSLDELPKLSIPAGYTLRTYRQGDDQSWEQIVQSSFFEPIAFAQKVASRPSYRPERVIFLCQEDNPVATASALNLEEPAPGNAGEDNLGYLHMVAALPSHAGHGLGRTVTLGALHRMKEDGKHSALLKTDDFRLPAIHTYLQLGFKPLHGASDHPARISKDTIQKRGDKKMNKQVTAGLVMALGVGMLAGCGSSNNNSDAEASSTPSQTASSSASASPSGDNAGGADLKGTITWATHRNELAETDLKKYVDAFEAKHPGTEIKIEGLKDYEQTIRVRMAANELPDVLSLVETTKADLPKFYEPLDDLGLNDNIYFKDYNSFNGKLYGITQQVAINGLLYNKKAFEKAGITAPPKTLDELFADADKLKAAGIVPMGTAFKDAWTLQYWMDPAEFINGSTALRNDKIKTDTPFTVDGAYGQGLGILKQLFDKGDLEKDVYSSTWDQTQKDLATGKTAMMYIGNWAISNLLNNGLALEDIGFAPLPYDNSGTVKGMMRNDWAYAVSSASKNKPLAKAFIKFMIEESGDYADHKIISPLKDQEQSQPQITDFMSYKPEMLEAQAVSADVTAVENKMQFDTFKFIQEVTVGKMQDVGSRAGLAPQSQTDKMDGRSRGSSILSSLDAARKEEVRMVNNLSYGSQKKILIILFLLIPIALLATFALYPAIYLVYLSFMSWDGFSPEKTWAGLGNYREVFSNKEIWGAFLHNLVYLGWGILQNGLGLCFALLLNSKLRGRNAYRVMLFMPYIMNGVAVAYMFNYVFNSEYGSFNTLLRSMGLDSLAISWFGSPKAVNHVLGFITLWKFMGLNMVIYLAALQSVPSDIIEAAKIDGATRFQTTTRVILPNITKVIELNLFLTIIGTLEIFDLPFILTNGGPLGASDTFLTKTIETAFKFNNFGMASAMSVTLITAHAILWFAVAMIIFPPSILVLNAFKNKQEFSQTSVFKLPDSFLNFDNFSSVITRAHLDRAYMNTLLIIAAAVIGNVALGTMVAYILGRFDFKMKKAVMGAYIAVSFVPTITTQVATFTVVNNLHLYNTLWASIVLHLGTNVLQIFIYLQFLSNIPRELDEAAMMEGASLFRIYRTIIFPLLAPATATIIIIKTIDIYNDMFIPYLYMPSQKLTVVSTSLMNFSSQRSTEWEMMSAAILMIMTAGGTGMGRQAWRLAGRTFERLWVGFANLNMQQKLLIVFLCLVCLPLVMISYASSYYYARSIETNTTTYATEITSKMLLKLDDYVTDLYNMSAMPLYNEDFINWLADPDMELAKVQGMDLYIANLNKIKPDTVSVYVYDNYGRTFYNIKSGGKRNNLDEVKSEWARIAAKGDGRPELVSTQSVSTDRNSYYAFSVIRELKNANNDLSPLGFIVFDTNITAINRQIEDFDDVTKGKTILVDANNKVIYDSEGTLMTHDLTGDESLRKSTDSRGSFSVMMNGKSYITTYAKSSLTGWKMFVYIPMEKATRQAAVTRNVTLLTSGAFVSIALIIAIAISYALTRPLSKIKTLMQEVQTGNLNVSFNQKYRDEVGLLGRHFNIMVTRVRDLLEEVKLTQTRKKEAEYAALQSQINPHFIYNTLETIRMKAELNDDEEVADMTFTLGKLLRYGVNHGEQRVTLGKELEHLTHYIALQNMRFSNKYKLIVDIPERDYEISCIKLMLQPIVENAVHHAFKNRLGPGTMRIAIRHEGEDVVFRVADDGCGMDDQKLKAVRERILGQRPIDPSGRGIGLRNVQERIKLQFGEAYGLRIDSEKDEGTVMVVDDEEQIRLGIVKILSKYAGGLEIAGQHANGLEALLRLSDMSPDELDVIITDIEMPMMDGLKFIEQAKTKMPDVCIIMLSGYNDFEYARQALRAGAADYLLKPMDKVEVFRLLDRCAERKLARTGLPEEVLKTVPKATLPESTTTTDRICKLIDQEYNRDIDLSYIADKVGFNASYISKLFSREKGETITDYLNGVRIEKAKQFLRDHPGLKLGVWSMATFETVGKDFLYEGKPIRIISGAMHYFRIVPEYWEDRLRKLRACGFNTVETYVAWNLHEPKEGDFRFNGIADVEQFVRLAGDLGLHVILRPSPYICAEWEFGGLPSWLLTDSGMRLRCSYPPYLAKVKAYYDELLPRLKPLLCTSGGPIIAMQIENEYGSYGNDKNYLNFLKRTMVEAGMDVLLFTSDGSEDYMLQGGTLPDVLATLNFGSKPEQSFEKLQVYRPDSPLVCMEYWNGWFDHWGDEHHVREYADVVDVLDRILAMGASVNFYMFLGGTNFGFYNGANHIEFYEPTVTSYDYNALLSESGDLTDKYWAIREVIGRYTDLPEEAPPAESVKKHYGNVRMTERVALFDSFDQLGSAVEAVAPETMEQLGQDYGFIWYETELTGPQSGCEIILQEVRDRATIYVDGTFCGVTERWGSDSVTADVPASGATLGILVENMGRINYGSRLKDVKGITEGVKAGAKLYNHFLFGWRIRCLPLDDLSGLTYGPIADSASVRKEEPAFYRGTFQTEETSDTFLKLEGWTKGVVFLNGFNLGRYWEKGPQKTLGGAMRMKIGIIGYGTRMHYFLDRLLELERGVEVAAIADLDLPKVKSLLAEKGLTGESVHFYTDADDMLEQEVLNGVMIGTRCSLHTEMAIKVMSRNLPLFLEKPVGISMADMRLLREAALRSTSEVVVSFPLRNTPIALLVKEIIDSGRLGSIEHVQAVNNVPYGGVYFHNWYRNEEETGGLFLQKATHDLDCLNFLLDLKPAAVSAMASKQVFKGDKPAGLRCEDCGENRICTESPYVLSRRGEEVTGDFCSFAVDTGNHDSASVLIRYESGMHAVYSQNFYSRKGAARRGARLIGYEGTVEFDWYQDEVKVFMHNTHRVETYKLEAAKLPHFGGDAALALNFISVMDGSEKSATPLSMGISSAWMCLKAEQAAGTDTQWGKPMSGRQQGLHSSVSHDEHDSRHFGAVHTPIYDSSLFTFPTIASMERAGTDDGSFIYSRGNNPTVHALECKLAELEGGERARCFATGMGAISAAVLSTVKAREHIVSVDQAYGPAREFMGNYLRKFGIETSFVDGSDLAAIEAALRPETKLLYLESPSSLFFELQNLRLCAELARSRGIRTIIDNTWATPCYQNPLASGIDLVVHSLTKYAGGHSDALG